MKKIRLRRPMMSVEAGEWMISILNGYSIVRNVDQHRRNCWEVRVKIYFFYFIHSAELNFPYSLSSRHFVFGLNKSKRDSSKNKNSSCASSGKCRTWKVSLIFLSPPTTFQAFPSFCSLLGWFSSYNFWFQFFGFCLQCNKLIWDHRESEK